MLSIIFFICIIIFIITLLLNNHTAVVPNNNMLLGVTLPYEATKNSNILKIVKKYKSSYVFLIFIYLALAIPLLIFKKYTSFSVIYLFLWITSLMLINNKLYIKYFNILYEIKKKNNWFFGALHILDSKNSIYVDDDEYWKNGYYYNPNDSNLIVEKRIGYGSTYNLATKKGKWITYGGISFSIIIGLSLSILFLILDISSFSLTIKNERASINAPIYSYEFNINEITDIKLIDTIPNGIRTNGASTDTYALGNFNLNTYGKSKMYIYKDNPPFISIELNNLYIFINGKTKAKTYEYYTLLQNHIK